jgi:DNA-directed RNA polymerase subunit M/transcription elongation factor TFIIS
MREEQASAGSAGSSATSYRCSACGNKTRFDVIEAKRVRSFLHFTLGGDVSVDEEEVLERTVERVVCRWCGSSQAIESAQTVSQQTEETGEPGK